MDGAGDEGSGDEQMKNDQLGKIFEVIGTPCTPEDLSFIKQEKAVRYIKSFPKKDRMDLLDKYPGTDERGLNLLQKMLEFNPEKRISAEAALKDSYFDEIRIPEQETFINGDEAQCDIDLRFDDSELPLEQLRKLIIEEIDRCKQTI